MARPANGERVRTVQCVLTCVLRNRTGATYAVTSYLAQRGCNILTCYALRLQRSVFTVTILFEADRETMQGLSEHLDHDLAEFSPKLVSVEDVKRPRPGEAIRHRVRLIACDEGGIVKDVLDVLARWEVDVVQLGGSQYPGPFSGTPLFCLDLKVEAPTREAAQQSQQFLERLARKNGWELDMYLDLDEEAERPSHAVYPPLSAVQPVRRHANRRRGLRRKS